jgi:hypothetical protein
MAKIKVKQRVSRFGNQVFMFKLANGRTVELEFGPHLMDPDGDACSASVSLLDENGERVPIGANEPRAEKKMVERMVLWFTTEEEDSKISRMVREELEALKESLKPITEHIAPPKDDSN